MQPLKNFPRQRPIDHRLLVSEAHSETFKDVSRFTADKQDIYFSNRSVYIASVKWRLLCMPISVSPEG